MVVVYMRYMVTCMAWLELSVTCVELRLPRNLDGDQAMT
jgi:hypothetical protein